MNSAYSRRNILILSTTSLATALLPSVGFAEPDGSVDTVPTPRSKKKTNSRSRDEQETIRRLEDELDDCSSDAGQAKAEIQRNAKTNASLQKKIDKEIALQLKLTESVKEKNATVRTFKAELRSGKNASGGKMTDKQRNAVLRKANRVLKSAKKDETALKKSKARVRNMRKDQNELRKRKRDSEGLKAKSVGACKRIGRKLRALKS